MDKRAETETEVGAPFSAIRHCLLKSKPQTPVEQALDRIPKEQLAPGSLDRLIQASDAATAALSKITDQVVVSSLFELIQTSNQLAFEHQSLRVRFDHLMYLLVCQSLHGNKPSFRAADSGIDGFFGTVRVMCEALGLDTGALMRGEIKRWQARQALIECKMRGTLNDYQYKVFSDVINAHTQED